MMGAVWTISSPEIGNYMDAGLINALMLLIHQTIVLCTSFGVIWMATTLLEADLRDQATHDPLTQVYNRRALDEIVAHEYSRSMRNKHPLSVVMTDIDLFKNLNDQFGHNTGDEVLKIFAGILSGNTRGHDTVARFGGEEFLILLPDTNITQAKLIAEKLRLKIAQHQHTQLLDSNTFVTASFGVTASDSENEPWMKVLERADHALYSAKHAGRNCVVVEES